MTILSFMVSSLSSHYVVDINMGNQSVVLGEMYLTFLLAYFHVSFLLLYFDLDLAVNSHLYSSYISACHILLLVSFQFFYFLLLLLNLTINVSLTVH